MSQWALRSPLRGIDVIRHFIVVCVAALLVLLGAFGFTAHDTPADFRYVNPSGIHTLDPARMSWTQDFRVALNIWEGLTTIDSQSLTPVGGAALFPPDISPDRTIFTFTIREDAKWSNGDPVTSHDFVRAWRRAMEPGTAADYSVFFTDHIVGASEYVAWRNAKIRTITALSRIVEGWGIDRDEAMSLAEDVEFVEALRTRDHGLGAMAGEIAPATNAVGDAAGASGEVGKNSRPLPSGRGSDAGSRASERGDRISDSSDSASTATATPKAAVTPTQTVESWLDELLKNRPLVREVHGELLRRHVEEMDERFNAVGIRAKSDRVLSVHLVLPCAYFLELTSSPVFLPVHKSIEPMRARYNGVPLTKEGLVVYDPQWTKPAGVIPDYPGLVTNGPYRLKDWGLKSRARLEVNPFFREAATIACRTIDMLIYESVDAALLAYEAGDVEFLPSLDVPYDHELARLSMSGERPDLHLCPVLATWYLNLNCESESIDGRPNPFVDVRVRRAFAMAIDKKAIVERVLARGDRVALSLVPPGGIPGYLPPAGLGYDPTRARDMMVEAGFPGGSNFPQVQLLYTSADERVCQTVAHMWEQELGVRVELRSKESKTFAEDKQNRRYFAAKGNWYADYNDPTTFLDILSTGNGNNDCGYSNAEYDRLLNLARTELDPAKRMQLLQQAESIVVESDLPLIPVFHFSLPMAIAPNVRGLTPNSRLWFPFRHVSVQR